MQNSIKRITLDVQQTHSKEVVYAKVGDTGREVHFSLTDGGVPYRLALDCSAVIRATKPDGTVLYNGCTIDGNLVKYKITSQTISAQGNVKCEITILDGAGKQLTSASFLICSVDRVVSDDEVESRDEFGAIANAISDANAAAAAADQAREDLLSAAENGEFNGERGEDGKSAYEAAQDGGYTGTEAEFNSILAKNSNPLVGTTETITPMQAFEAVKAGRPVRLTHNIGDFIVTMENFVLEEEEFKVIYCQINDPDSNYIIYVSGSEEGGENAPWYEDKVQMLPYVGSFHAGEFLRVSASGKWVAQKVPSAEGASF